MSFNYYQILQLSEKATATDIDQAYRTQLQKWQTLRKNQPVHLQERTDKVLEFIDIAYKTLSNPSLRTQYNKALKLTSSETPTSTKTTKKPPNNKLYLIILVLLIIAGTCYFILSQNLVSTLFTSPPSPQAPAAETPTTAPLSATPPNMNEALKQAEQLKKINAQNPALKALAKQIEEAINSHINTIINYNTQLFEAKASNQNITVKFKVIDGITHSKNLLSTYITERFILDNNEVCKLQKINVEKGLLFTFAYYNSQDKLIGSYYIDQQVCESPINARILKKPDQNQLDSIEVTTD